MADREQDRPGVPQVTASFPLSVGVAQPAEPASEPHDEETDDE